VEDREAEQLILETLFDIRRAVFDIHGLIFRRGEDEEETEDDS
jgi:hypothetical protein